MTDFTQHGSCNCQSIRYTITDAPLFTHVCHCTKCQKRTGSAFVLNAMVLEDDFALSEGALDSFSTLTDSGAELSAYTCPSCRDVLYYTLPGFQRIIMVAGGTFDDASWLKPDAHIFTRSKQAWVELSDEIPAYREMYELEKAWPQASLAKLAES
ncbi:MAG: aldehyde-activating protein [Gammaproteobacteria bacterium]|nr:MAG: aldehyde-activating protein [Gammaproteobacteria bacterium]RLA54330.1 MAG: aldehyde-activating protein [Gammaproteobacteria bacterium]